MSVSAPCPADSPLMIAWNAYKATEEYANTKKWAVFYEHVEGSLWASFMAGFEAQKGALSESPNIGRWVSTSERLPEDGQVVLGFLPATSRYPISMESLTYLASDAPDSVEAWRDWEDEDSDAPTHWMPLPEAPK